MSWDPGSDKGGAENYSESLAYHLKESDGTEITVARNPLHFEGQKDGILWTNKEKCYEQSYDILISIKDFDSVLQCKAKKKFLVLTQFVIVPKAVDTMVDMYIVMSQKQFDYLKGHGINPTKIKIIPNAYESTFVDKIETSKHKKDYNRVLFAGATVDKKGFNLLLDVWPFIEKPAESKLVIVGSSQLWGLNSSYNINKEQSASILNLGLQTRIGVFEQMLEAGVFVLPSLNDCAPTSIIEAQACGCFVIASNIGGIPEYSKYGRLVPPGDSVALKKALEGYFKNVEYYKNLAKLGEYWTQENYQWRNVIKFWEHLIA